MVETTAQSEKLRVSGHAIPPSPERRPKANTAAGRKPSLFGDVFLGFMIVASLGAATTLAIPLRGPPVVVSTFLAIAISTLVYRFLGGIPASTAFVVKGVQIGGSLGALLASYALFNSHLEGWAEREARSRLKPAFGVDELVGTWVQVYPEKRWRGEYTFTKVGADSLQVDGFLREVSLDSSPKTLLKVVQGTAVVADGGLMLDITLKGTAEGGFRGETVRWKTKVPVTRQRATRGTFEVDKTNAEGHVVRDTPWDFGLTKTE